MTTEMTTAATDGAVGLLSVALLFRLRRVAGGSARKKSVWPWVFRLIALGSALSVVGHGALPERERALLWLVLYLALSLSVGFFLAGAVADWRDDAAARALLPWTIALAVGFLAVSRLFDGSPDVRRNVRRNFDRYRGATRGRRTAGPGSLHRPGGH